MDLNDDDISEEVLSNAREGPPGRIAKSMMDSIIAESSSENTPGGATYRVEQNTPEGSTTPSVGSETDLKVVEDSKTVEEADVVMNQETEKDANETESHMTSSSRSKRSESGDTYTMEPERDASRLMTPTPTSTEVGEALVSEVLTKVKKLR